MKSGFPYLGKLYLSFTRQIHSVPQPDRKFPIADVLKLRGLGEKSLKRPFKISVEGNIGSGKTTVINYFSRFPTVQTYGEPLEKWRNVQGHNLLGLLYEDMIKWNTAFQSYVQLTRMQIQSSIPGEGIKVQVFERSVQNNRHCFLENSYKNGHILPAQYEVLCKWYEWIKEKVDISLDLIVYMRTDPKTVYERIRRRNRSEEKAMTLDYLESVHEALENWLSDPAISDSVITIDANPSLSHVLKSYEIILQTLHETMQKNEIHTDKTENEEH